MHTQNENNIKDLNEDQEVTPTVSEDICLVIEPILQTDTPNFNF